MWKLTDGADGVCELLRDHIAYGIAVALMNLLGIAQFHHQHAQQTIMPPHPRNFFGNSLLCGVSVI